MQNKLGSFFSRYEFLIPIFLCLLFLAVSLPGVSWGAPALWNPDELIWRVDSALRGEMVFDVSEPDFNYPSLPKYVMYAIGSLVYATGRSSFAVIVAARSFSCLLGALAGALIYSIARMIGADRKISFLSGLLYIASGVAAANGRFAHNDLYLQLFSILSVFFVIKYQKTYSVLWLFSSFFSVGLAASSKYTGGSLILLPAAVYVIMNWAQIRSRWFSMFGTLFLGGMISFFGYGIGTPKALFSPIYYFSNVIPALRNYPQYGFNSGAQIGLFGQWAVFKSAVGIFAYYVFILAFLWFVMRLLLWRTGRGRFENHQAQGVAVLLGAVLIFDLPFLISINYIGRYFIPFVPFLAILGALFVDEVIRLARRGSMNFVQPVMIMLLAVGISYSLLRLTSIALLFENDARIPASEYIATMRGYQKSMEYTLYPPLINKRQFERAHNYPIYFVKYPTDVVPTGGRYEYNQGEQGLLERDTDYLVIDTLTYDRFYTESICDTNPVECNFFKKLLAGEISTFRLLKKFTYALPPYLPQVSISAVNPEIRIYERVR
ncbi:MAG: phospholipid carrier-dependent glycosyltransferase [Anaerolineales bacterium]|nr:phospholipid carrier-dependent glycosyltransferase [Anaerolineales bacterium]